VPVSTRTARLGNRSGRRAVSPNHMPVHVHTRHAGTYLWVLRHLAKSQPLTRGAGLKADWAVGRAWCVGRDKVWASPDCAVRATLVLSRYFILLLNILFCLLECPQGFYSFQLGFGWLRMCVSRPAPLCASTLNGSMPTVNVGAFCSSERAFSRSDVAR
jgi:hypothetical protein